MHVILCGGDVEGNAHFEVKSLKTTWASMLKLTWQQDFQLCAFDNICLVR